MLFFFEVPSTRQLESKRQVEGQKFEFWQVTIGGCGSMEAKYTSYLPKSVMFPSPKKWDDPVFHLSIPDCSGCENGGVQFSLTHKNMGYNSTLLGTSPSQYPHKRLVSLKQLNLKKKHENSYATTLNYPGILNISPAIFRHFLNP